MSYRQHTARNEACMLHRQNICGLRRKINEVILSFYIHSLIFCFSEIHLKHTQINCIPIKNCVLGVEYCGQFFDEDEVCIFIHKDLKFSTINLHEFINTRILRCAQFF